VKVTPTADQIQAAAREQFAGPLALSDECADRWAMSAVPPTVDASRFVAGYYDDEDECPAYTRRNGLAIVSIRGALSQRGGWWWDGHEAIRGRIENALLDPLVSCVVLEINSPGGVVAGMIDCVEAVQRAQASSGKEIFAYAREHAYSAAYAWAMCATSLYLPEAGGAGSIGVLSVLLDARKMYEDFGLRALVIRSGDRKARGMPIEGFDDQTIAAEQARVDKLAGLFFALVEKSRGVKTAALRALEGDVFDGSAAVEKKLADGVLPWDDFLAKAEAAGKKWKMKGIARALGLQEDATEAQIEEAARNTKARADKVESISAKAAEVATAYALVTGRIDSGQRDGEIALIKAAPVEAITALMNRKENSAVPQPSREPRPDASQGQPPPVASPNAWAQYEALDSASLGRWYASLVTNPAAVQYLAASNPNLYKRASAAFGATS
jgi:ClpP class serine protease